MEVFPPLLAKLKKKRNEDGEGGVEGCSETSSGQGCSKGQGFGEMDEGLEEESKEASSS